MNPKSPLSVEQIAEVISASTQWAYSLALRSLTDTEVVRAITQFTDIQRGQLVVEVSAAGRSPALQRVGILKDIAKKPYTKWDVSLNGPRPTREVYTIELLNGQLQDWENCMFIAAPQTPLSLI